MEGNCNFTRLTKMLAKFVLAAQGARATRNHNHYLRPLIQNKPTSMLVFREGGEGAQKSYKMGKYFFLHLT